MENLGLVELLRRGCTEIYCFDAAGDQVDTFFTLGEAVALARTELGIEIDIDPEVLRPAPQQPGSDARMRRSPDATVVATFTFPKKWNGKRVAGRLVYAKAAIMGSHPWDVKAYGQKDEAFPAHGTVHQLYLEERFEAYRALGHTTGHRAVSYMRYGEPVVSRLLRFLRGMIHQFRTGDQCS